MRIHRFGMIHRSGLSVAVAALLSVVAASPCFAQRDGDQDDQGRRGGRGGADRGGPGRGGPFGGGPFGGGMFGGGMGGGDMMLLGLLRVDEVRKELDLMPDQVEALQKVGQEVRGERPDFDFRNATPAERQEFAETMRKRGEEASAKIREQLDQVLLPEQNERLRQIGLQQQGVAVFYDPQVAKELELSEEQKEKLNQVQQSAREKMIAAIREGGQDRDREAMGKMMAESRKATLAEARQVLTSEQQQEFDEMLGKPFEMPAGAMGGFRGQRGGEGFGGRGGRRGDGEGRRGEGRRGGDRGGDRGDN
ncbi:hypothetical protein [Candidatus Laterigemmans baculatus]|uniref:hypothetical protein n=1 Tax=Candidatus Laterigemmans baculatus TaxID=2770505 RepID=UPI0013DAEFE2|nr:hypothetical protein [Candidatus Laterigemmans baculatus]